MGDKELRGELADLMEDDDWALIFDNHGRLKGIFIPDGKNEEEVPERLAELLDLFETSVEDVKDATVH